MTSKDKSTRKIISESDNNNDDFQCKTKEEQPFLSEPFFFFSKLNLTSVVRLFSYRVSIQTNQYTYCIKQLFFTSRGLLGKSSWCPKKKRD